MKRLVLVVLLAWVQLAFPSERTYAMVRTLVPPARIVAASGDVLADSASQLCGERYGQVPEWRFLDGSGPVLEKGNWLILDFGRELHGSLQIGSGAKSGRSNRVRVRFGESVAETMAELVGPGEKATATNDHAIRDDYVLLPWLGRRTIGETGFAKFHVEPHLPDGVESFEAAFRTTCGREIRVRAWREGGEVKFDTAECGREGAAPSKAGATLE